MHPLYDVNGEFDFALMIPSCQIVETFLEEGGLRVLEEVGALDASDGGG